MTKFLFSTFCCCILSFSAFTQVINGIEYYIAGTTATVVSMNPKYSGNINIPSTVDYEGKNYTVTRIGNHAFLKCIGLTSITLPNSITSIGNSAFKECTGLTSVILSNNLTNIGNSAFRDCINLTSITLPSNLTSIGKYAFWGCEKLAPVTVPKSVTSIGVLAFPGYSRTTNATPAEGETKPMEEFKKCPYCAEEILSVATKCKHCGEWLDKTATSKVQFKPEKGSFCVEVQFRPLGDIIIQSEPNGPGSAGGISAKCFVSKKSELRIDLLFGFSSDKEKNPVPEGKTGKEEVEKNTATAFGLNLGLNYHFNGTERISPYIGFLLGFGVGNEKVNINNWKFVSGDYHSSHKERFLGMQIMVATGFNWYIVKGLYIGAEVGLGLGFEKMTKKSEGEETPTITENPTGSNFGISFFATPAIRLGWKF